MSGKKRTVSNSLFLQKSLVLRAMDLAQHGLTIFAAGSDSPGVHHMGAWADLWFLWWAVEDAAQ